MDEIFWVMLVGLIIYSIGTIFLFLFYMSKFSLFVKNHIDKIEEALDIRKEEEKKEVCEEKEEKIKKEE